MTTIRGGYLNKFVNDLNKLQNNKTDFQVVSSGLTRKIIFNQKEENSKRLYFGHQKDSQLAW